MDVSSVRGRKKRDFIHEVLRRNMVVTRVLRPGYGEVVVYEHEFQNPYTQEMVRGGGGLTRRLPCASPRPGLNPARYPRPVFTHVLCPQVFELRMSSPQEVSVITRMDEYRALRAANARFFGSATQPVGHLEQEIMSGNRLFLQVKAGGGGGMGYRACAHAGWWEACTLAVAAVEACCQTGCSGMACPTGQT